MAPKATTTVSLWLPPMNDLTVPQRLAALRHFDQIPETTRNSQCQVRMNTNIKDLLPCTSADFLRFLPAQAERASEQRH